MIDYEIKKAQDVNGSVAIVLPKKYCKKLGIGKGDYCKIIMNEKNQIEVTKA